MKGIRTTLFIFLLAALPASAQMYRWVDAKGTVNYSNEAPPQGVKATKVDMDGEPIERVAATPRPARGLDSGKYRSIRRGMSESDLIGVAGAPDLRVWDSKFLMTYTYFPTTANPFTTTITLVRGRVSEIERVRRF
jgi:hypothetical protein